MKGLPKPKFTYLGISIQSLGSDVNIHLAKAWTTIGTLSIISKFNLSDKIKTDFFYDVIVSLLLYGCTIWTLTKRIEKNVNVTYTKMLRALLNKYWKQHPTKQQLYGHLPLISNPIQIRRTRDTGYCCRSEDELIGTIYQPLRSGRI